MLSLQEISDRLEIQQLLVDYSTALDQRRFDDLDAVFTPDAYIDYRAMGGIDGNFPEVKTWLAQVLFCGFWYDDQFVRTAEGWRMTRRVETKCFDKLV
jgi:hypothetical protein